MRYVLLIAILSFYFVEWIPNNATAAPPPPPPATSSPGEFPWQL